MNFLLLYSTEGFNLLGTKRVLVRPLPGKKPKHLRWKLLDQADRTCMEGSAAPLPVTLGMQTYACDFSSFCGTGTFRLEVTADGFPPQTTDFFPIGDDLLSQRLFGGLTIQNALARKAVHHQHGGLYDCNSMMGEAYSHGIFLAALIQMLRSGKCPPGSEEQVLTIAGEVFDYLLYLLDADTGVIANYAAERPFDANHVLNPVNTQEGLYGMAAYLAYCKAKDASRANDEVFAKLQRSLAFLEELHAQGKGGLYPHGEELAVIDCFFYQYSGDEQWLRKAEAQQDELLRQCDLSTDGNSAWRGIPRFEGSYRLACERPEFFAVPARQAALNRLAAQYQDMMQRSAYRLPLLALPASPQQAWARPEEMPDMVPGQRYWYVNCGILTLGMDACFLGMLCCLPQLEAAAAAAIYFVLGENFGLPSTMAEPAAGSHNPCTASFLANSENNHAKAWSQWYYQPLNSDWLSLTNGYQIRDGQFIYEDDYLCAETFIKTDGIFVSALCFYEQWNHCIHASSAVNACNMKG